MSFCVGAFITPVWTQVQGGAKPAVAAPAAVKQATYMTVEFMKVPEGKEESWLKLERESWKPMHALRIKNGLIESWWSSRPTMRLRPRRRSQRVTTGWNG